MQVLSYAVNSFFPTPLSYQQPQVLVFVNQFLGEANYNKAFAHPQGVRKENVEEAKNQAVDWASAADSS
jgi:hypothetical protein